VTRLSELQFPMLREFADMDASDYMTIERAQTFDQRPFRSMLIQKWVTYVKGRGFHITPAGRNAWHGFQHRDIFRRNPMAPLTSYFKHTPSKHYVMPLRKIA
jgi:hypothetical protein